MPSTSDASHKMAELAVFDLDGTCIDGQSGFLISTYLISQHMLGSADAARLAWWGIRYKLHLPHRQGEPREIIIGVLSRLGLSSEETDALMVRFHDEVIVPRYRPEAVAELRRRQQEGKVTLLASATFDQVARCAADYLGTDGHTATIMERDASGAYTGRVEGDVTEGKGKLRAVASWADEHVGAGQWIIACAYGDHHSDAELLGVAREPYAVCPSSTLKRLAERHGWTLLDWAESA